MIEIRKIAFIGGGNMAAALIGGLIARGLAPARIVVADPSIGQRQRLIHEYGVAAAQDNASAAQDAEVLVLAVKPQHMREAALGLAAHLGENAPLTISVAAGIPHAALVRWLGPRTPVVRAMPNRPALCGYGATGLYAPRPSAPRIAPSPRPSSPQWALPSGSSTKRRWTPSPRCPAAVRPIFSSLWRRSKRPRARGDYRRK